MSSDAVNSWIDKAKNNQKSSPKSAPKSGSVQVITRVEPQSRGNMIMEIAEKIRPWLMKMFEGVRGEDGILLQPANIRGIALNVAQNILKEQEAKK